MHTATLHRYRAAYSVKPLLEPVADPATLETMTVHAPSASYAARAIQHLTGAAFVDTPERLDDLPDIAPTPRVRQLVAAGIDPDIAKRLEAA